MALTGDKIDDVEFWKAAKYIDVNGPHHIKELSQESQNKLNAVYAWNATQERVRYSELTDVTDVIQQNYDFLEKVLNEKHIEHSQLIQNGIDWEKTLIEQIEACLIKENENVRVFSTKGIFCSAAYYSPAQTNIIPAIVTYNEKFNSITVSIADSKKSMLNARLIVQELWGPEAGGHAGIAGSPREQVMTQEDLENAVKLIEQKVQSIERSENNVKTQSRIQTVQNSFGEIKDKEEITINNR